MRHADGSIASSTAWGRPAPTCSPAVLAQDDAVAPPPLNAPYAGYQRLDRGGAVLIAATPRPPPARPSPPAPMRAPAPSSSRPRAPHRRQLRARRPAHRPELASFARVTAAHSTIAVADEGLGRFVRSRMMKAILGDQFIGGAKRVAMTRSVEAEASVLTLEHDGWRRHGFIHKRRPHPRRRRPGASRARNAPRPHARQARGRLCAPLPPASAGAADALADGASASRSASATAASGASRRTARPSRSRRA